MITLTKTINKLPKNLLLKTNKVVNRFEMNIKTRTGNHQQATPRAPPFLHFLGGGEDATPKKKGKGRDPLGQKHATWQPTGYNRWPP